jgi:diguanylate cyclase
MHSAKDRDLLLLDAEMQELLASVPMGARELLSEVVRVNRGALVDQFYDVMVPYPGAEVFLGSDLVHDRLHGAMSKWLEDLFTAKSSDVEHLRRRQMEVGAVHARIKVPVSLVMRAFRELKRGIIARLVDTRCSTTDLAQATKLLAGLLDIALAIMTNAYALHSEQVARSDEAFRLYSVGHDLMTEREKQRAAIMEWAQEIFFGAQLPGQDAVLQSMSGSSFGLWFTHRARIVFGEPDTIDLIADAISRCDGLVDSLNNPATPDRMALIRSVKAEVTEMVRLVTLMFDSAIDHNSAYDPVTKLVMRQFLSPAVSREIGLCLEGRPHFSLVSFVVDASSAQPSVQNAEAWDEALRRIAQVISTSSRSSDTAFRLSDHRFMVLRVESDAEAADQFGRVISDKLKNIHFTVWGQSVFGLGVRYAVTEYDGHPDPRRINRRAEQALLE